MIVLLRVCGVFRTDEEFVQKTCFLVVCSTERPKDALLELFDFCLCCVNHRTFSHILY